MDETSENLYQPITGIARVKYFTIRILLKAAGKTAAVLPEKMTYGLCVRLALFGHRRFPRYRRIAREQLETAFGGEKSAEEIEAILKQSYINQGKNLAEFLMIPYKSAAWVNSRIVFSDPRGNIAAELAKGRGVIAVGAHVGNNELVCAWLGVHKTPMVTVVKAQRDALINAFITETRLTWGTEIVFRARGVKRECLRQLGMNKIIGLVADQNTASSSVYVDYFGKKAATATGPADIAMRTGLPILPAFMSTRNPDDTLTVHVLDLIHMRDTGDTEKDIAHNTQLYTTAIENFVRKYPSEYLWWHRRWKTQQQDAAAQV